MKYLLTLPLLIPPVGSATAEFQAAVPLAVWLQLNTCLPGDSSSASLWLFSVPLPPPSPSVSIHTFNCLFAKPRLPHQVYFGAQHHNLPAPDKQRAATASTQPILHCSGWLATPWRLFPGVGSGFPHHPQLNVFQSKWYLKGES